MKRKLLKGLAVAIAFACVSAIGVPTQKSTNAYSWNALLAYREMQAMSSVKWKPQKTMEVVVKQKPDGTIESTSTYSSNKTYYGIPYSQKHNSTYNDFQSKVSNGVYTNLTYVSDNKTYYGQNGNDCSTAVALAWKTSFSSIKYAKIYTQDWLDCARSGSNSTYHLKSIGGTIGSNKYSNNWSLSKEEVLRRYKNVKEGDSLFYRNKSGSGHALLVINLSYQGFYCLEQCGLSGNTSWKQVRYSYDELYNSHYLPVRCWDVN